MEPRIFPAVTARSPDGLYRVAFRVSGPFGGHPVELKLRVLQRDMGIKSGAGSSHQIGRNIFNISSGMLLAPHIKKDGLDIRPALTSSIFFSVLPLGPVTRDERGEFSGVLMREVFKKHSCQIDRFRLRCSWVILDELWRPDPDASSPNLPRMPPGPDRL